MILPDEAVKMGAPPHWLGHVSVADADASAARAQELGGKLLVPVQHIPEVGRFAILSDPQGAVFSAYTPAGDMPGHTGEPRAGDMSWHELNTTDYQAAWKFYSELFGWKNTSSMDMGPEMGAYWMFGLDPEKPMGGMSNVAKQMKMPPHWLYYVTVDDIDATVASIQKNGGKILNGPMDVPGNDKIAQCMDPQGAAFAIYMQGKK
jgi:predicted enzyme related to lactoylglutathione lyase